MLSTIETHGLPVATHHLGVFQRLGDARRIKRHQRQGDAQDGHQREIHRTLTEKNLEREYNIVKVPRSHPEISRFVRWIEKKPHGLVGRGACR